MPISFIAICDSVVIKSIFGVILQVVVLITAIIGFFSYKNKENFNK